MSDYHFVMPTTVANTVIGSPLADANAGGTPSDVVNMKGYHECYFMILFGARTGTTAAPVITVLSCDDTTPTNSQAIPFEYKLVSSTDTNTAWTAVAATGLTVTTGDDFAIIIKVMAEDAYSGYEYVQMSMTEPADDPQVMACLIMMAEPRYNEATLDTVTT